MYRELVKCSNDGKYSFWISIKKNMNAEKNATTSKFGQFLPLKNCTFWVIIAPKNAQDEVRPHFCVHNCV